MDANRKGKGQAGSAMRTRVPDVGVFMAWQKELPCVAARAWVYTRPDQPCCVCLDTGTRSTRRRQWAVFAASWHLRAGRAG